MEELDNIKLIELPKFMEDRGNLTFIEKGNQVPFDIRRVYMIYDVPGGEIRGGHAYKKQVELVIALSGSFEVFLSDGFFERIYLLNRSYTGILIPAGIWRRLQNFSTNSLALVLASTSYQESDYIRDYKSFLEYRDNEKKSVSI